MRGEIMELSYLVVALATLAFVLVGVALYRVWPKVVPAEQELAEVTALDAFTFQQKLIAAQMAKVAAEQAILVGMQTKFAADKAAIAAMT
jgi:hypothetical protein